MPNEGWSHLERFPPRMLSGEKGPGTCESCVEIDARIDVHRQVVRSTTDPSEIERINRLIAQLYADRVRLHKNPE